MAGIVIEQTRRIQENQVRVEDLLEYRVRPREPAHKSTRIGRE